MARSVRDYIKIVEGLDEATWWPSKKPAPSPYSGMKGAAKAMAPRPPDNFSAAISDLGKNVVQLEYGREEYLHGTEYLVNQLLQQANQAGMQQFVPILTNMSRLLQRGDIRHLTQPYDALKQAFDALMASEQYA